jgi:Domain of unknown function (DUF4388)
MAVKGVGGMAQLAGSLDSVPLPNLLGFLHTLNKSGYLELSEGRARAEIGLDRGLVVNAAFDSRHGVEALEAAVLMLPAGQFSFTEGVLPKDRDINTDTDELVTHLDDIVHERTILGLAMPWHRAVPSVAPTVGEVGEIMLDGPTVETLLAVDGKRTVGDIALVHGAGRTAHAIKRLQEAGIVSVEPLNTETEPAA